MLTKQKGVLTGKRSEWQAQDAIQLLVTNHISFNPMEKFVLTEIAEKPLAQKSLGRSM